ncbi:MAG TPA: hypothetical protein VIZ30_10680 [Pseudomonadales bacterium]
MTAAQESAIADAHFAARHHLIDGERKLQHFVDGVRADAYDIKHWMMEDWKIERLLTD